MSKTTDDEWKKMLKNNKHPYFKSNAEHITSVDLAKAIIEAGGYVKDEYIKGIHHPFTGEMELRLADKFNEEDFARSIRRRYR